jgi:hypothetical protein
VKFLAKILKFFFSLETKKSLPTSSLLALDGFMSKSSSSPEVVESLLSGKLRTLMGDVNCFGEVRVEEADDDGTSLLAIGMKLLLLLFLLLVVVVGEDTRIFRGGGLQSLSHELLLLFFLLF